MNPIEIKKEIRALEATGVKCSGNPSLPPAPCCAAGDWRCPNCGKGPTVRDYMAVFERCLQCGWYQELSHEARSRLLHND